MAVEAKAKKKYRHITGIAKFQEWLRLHPDAPKELKSRKFDEFVDKG